jgi:diguanylate cyclase (GGDEF)-like protein
MITKSKKKLFQYIKEGFYSQDNHEEAIKIYLIYGISLVGFIFVLALGLKGIHTSALLLTTFLLGGSVFLLLNIFYLYFTKKHLHSGYAVLYFFFALMIYLVYAGGVENTGPLWIYCLPPMALYMRGLKRGLFELSIFILIIIYILFYNHINIEAEYTYTFKLRIILSFLLVTFITAVYGYSREKSSKKMVKMQKDLEFFLRRDELTGLYNRRGYQDKIYSIQNTYGAILMCDIDYFKKINDTYGHDVGDFTIQEVSKCIRDNLRKDDVAVRWGGEEFFVFLSEVNMKNAYIVSEKLRESVENLSIKYSDGMVLNTTISIGIAPINDTLSLEQAIKNADSAMYTSKADGRNKSSLFREQ